MDPLRIALRALAVYLFLLVLLRWSGKRTIRQGSPFDFVLAIVVGDLIDDALWNEVPFVQFVVAVSTLFLSKLTATTYRTRTARR